MFRPDVQTEPNGYLTPEFRSRIASVKAALGLTLADLGEAFGFSGQFVHNLLAGKTTHRMHSKHTDRIVAALEDLEVRAGILAAPVREEHGDDLADLIRRIHRLGFSVELKPLAQ